MGLIVRLSRRCFVVPHKWECELFRRESAEERRERLEVEELSLPQKTMEEEREIVCPSASLCIFSIENGWNERIVGTPFDVRLRWTEWSWFGASDGCGGL